MLTDPARQALPHSDEIYTHISPIRIAIVEDMQCIADLIISICERHWGLEVIGTAHSGTEGIDMIRSGRPDVVLLDLGLPDIDGITVASRINTLLPSTKILVVSSLCNDYYLHRLRSVETRGFVDKFEDGLFSLRRAIERIHRGGTYFSPRFLKASRRLKESHHAFFKVLSDREQEVLLWASQSLNDDEIAAQLDISPATVQTHRREVMRKLDIHSAPKLVRYGLELGMIPGVQGPLPVHA